MTADGLSQIRQLAAQLVSGPAAPDRIFGQPDVSYRSLYTAAARLRTVLAGENAAPVPVKRPVCLCTNDRVVTAAALLATLGDGPPLVMPHAHSESVLAELHGLTRFELAIVDQACPLPPGTREIAFQDLPSAGDAPETTFSLDPEAPWVHLFTGGSTGAPQLWTKTVRNLLGEAAYLQRAFAVTSGDRVLTTSPPYHIYGLLYSVLVPLLAGAGVLTATPAFPVELADAIETQKPTILVTVPAYYRVLKNHLPVQSRLRMAFSSASPLAEADADAFSQVTGVPIYDVYGSTETGGIAGQCRAAGETGFTPFSCVDLQIHNEHLRVRSPFLSPQLPVDAGGYYQAADRAFTRKDGTFTVIGRADGIIKVGGKRVDLAEIRARLMKVKAVRDALVLARPTVTGRGHEVLALVETDLPGEAVRRSLDTALEPHARPRAIRAVSQMPVTRTGKYDREAIERLFKKTKASIS